MNTFQLTERLTLILEGTVIHVKFVRINLTENRHQNFTHLMYKNLVIIQLFLTQQYQ